MPRGLLPALTIAACAVALLPAVPALAADGDLSTTIERDGVTLQFQRSSVTTAWPLAIDATPDRGAARFDLDGDGVDELILTTFLFPASGPDGSALLVRYHTGRVERLVKASPSLGGHLSVADFNGDGFGDLAVAEGSSLWTLNGSADGLVPESAIRLTPKSAGMPADATTLSGVQAVADLNGDGYDDLAIGQPSRSVNSKAGAGAVTVLRGGPGGLSGTGSAQFTQDSAGVPGDAATNDAFGSSVAIGDVTGDAHPDLVVGAETDVDGDTGSITVLPGTATGPTGTGATAVTAAQLDNVALHVRHLGSEVSVAEVTGDGRADVVAGAEQSTVVGRQLAGTIVALAGSATGVSAGRSAVWNRGGAGVVGRPGTMDNFGSTVTLGDVTGDGRPDLVTGSPWAHVGEQTDAGLATVVPNSEHGLTGKGSTEITRPGTRVFGMRTQVLELTGAGRREFLVGGQQVLTLYRASDDAVVSIASLNAATFGANGIGVYDLGSTAGFPRGVPLPVPAAGPVVPPVTPVLKQPRSRYDFDGDGKDEIVVGNSDGAVVRYSVSGRIDQLDPRPATSGARPSFAAGDFNGDGYADLAMGDYTDNRDKPALQNLGAVSVTYGGPTGLDYAHGQVFTQDTAGILDTSEDLDGFGAALAAGDLNGDGRADLAIGTPWEDTGKATDGGAVTVLYGSPTGLTTTSSGFFAQSAAWIPDAEESRDDFGAALAIGDVTGDKRADLAIGSPGENGLGSVTLVKGAAAGLSETGANLVIYSEIGRSTASGAAFGSALAVADLNKDGKAEVIAGAPDATAGTVLSAGQVVAFTGSASGIAKSVLRIVHQDTVGAPGASESGDGFGSSLATGDITGDGYVDVLIGSPSEATGALQWAGMVNMFPGSSAGITGTGGAGWDQNSAGVPDSAEEFDQFGSAVSVLNLNGTGGLDALIGSGGETTPESGIGSVTEFVASGTTLTPTTQWNPVSLFETDGLDGGGPSYLGTTMLGS